MLKVWNIETAHKGDICVNYLRTGLCETYMKCFMDYRVYSRYNFQGLFQLLSNQCCVAFDTNAALLRAPPQRKHGSKHLVCFALLNHERGA